MDLAPGFIHPTLDKLKVDVASLNHYGKNPRRGDVDAIAASLEKNGQYKAIVVRAGSNEVLAGNHTLKAAKKLGWTEIAATFVDVDDDSAARIVLADNRTAELAGYDDGELNALLESLPDLEGTGFDEDYLKSITDGAEDDAKNSSLVERFGAPPFTVLDARQGVWQKRKAAWKSLGIESELGRDEKLVFASPQSSYQNWYPVKNRAEAAAGGKLTAKEIFASPFAEELIEILGGTGGTSIFDPVLCELLYRWFSPAGAHILDPWAGGSVRGLVAARLGRKYTGIELRAEQVEANRSQVHLSNGPLQAMLAAAAKSDQENDEPVWVIGESSEQLATLDPAAYDMILGCPPYYDLETYSDDERDMSNMSPAEFDIAMIENVKQAAARLKPDSYAVFIVGAVRNDKGHLMDMRSLMVRAAQEAGLHLANDAMLVTAIGTAAIQAARGFTATRTLARTHQDVLIFLKGDRKAAAARMGSAETEASLESLDSVVLTPEVMTNGTEDDHDF